MNVYLPVKVEGLPPVAEVHCGWSHTLTITTGRYDDIDNIIIHLN